MSGTEERKFRLNFYPHELESLKCIALRHRVLENGTLVKAGRLQNGAWQSITEQFNAQNNNNKRTADQLKGVWKRLKKECKSYPSSVKSEDLQTGCWPRSPFQDIGSPGECKGMDRLFKEPVVPVVNTPTDCDSYIDVEDIQDVWKIEDPITQTPTYPSGTSQPDSWSTTSTEPVTNHNFGVNNLTTKVEAFEEHFHATRMAYLKEEHALKMKVFEEELRYWRRMNCSSSQSQYAEAQSPPIIEQETYQLLSGAIHRF